MYLRPQSIVSLLPIPATTYLCKVQLQYMTTIKMTCDINSDISGVWGPPPYAATSTTMNGIRNAGYQGRKILEEVA